MRIVAVSTLKEFWTKHADAEQPLRTWVVVVKASTWTSTVEIKQTFAAASVIDAETVVFNIHGNDYRLVARLYFPAGILYVKFIGSHADYDRLDL